MQKTKIIIGFDFSLTRSFFKPVTCSIETKIIMGSDFSLTSVWSWFALIPMGEVIYYSNKK